MLSSCSKKQRVSAGSTRFAALGIPSLLPPGGPCWLQAALFLKSWFHPRSGKEFNHQPPRNQRQNTKRKIHHALELATPMPVNNCETVNSRGGNSGNHKCK